MMNETTSIAWMKETLLSFALNQLPINEHIDVALSIDIALKRGILTKQHFILLREYLYGYTANEIAEHYNLSITDVEVILFNSIQKISIVAGYEDSLLISRAHRNKKSIKKIIAFKEFLMKVSKQFNEHTISKR
jgi:DNA-binding NarL/FixJ family response regulator